VKAATKLAKKKKPEKKPASRLKTSVFCGTSLDGFLARPDDTFDFLDVPGIGPHGFKEFLASVDVIVLGRRTFEVVQKLGHAGLYGKIPVIVLSRSPLDLSGAKGGKFEHMSGEPAEIVAQLAARGYKHAYVDGGITIQRFLAAGQLDRIIVTRVPVLVGQGIPLFGPLAKDLHLRHIRTESFKAGLVQSEYEVLKG
jgi:dihydrofolate reductase